MATKKYSLNKKEANDVLQNVFDACNVSHNTVPFDKIMLRSMAETKLVTVFKYIGIAALIVVLLTPLLFKRDQTFVLSSNRPGQKIIVVDHQLYENQFLMVLYGTGIKWEEIHCLDEDGCIVYPTSIEKESGTVIFPYGDKALNIYIPNDDGDVLQGVLARPNK